MDLKHEIKQIIRSSSVEPNKLDIAILKKGNRVIDEEDIEEISNRLIKLFSLHSVSNPLFTPVKFGEWILRNVAEGYSDDIGICWLLEEENLSTKELFEIYKNNPNDC